MSIYKIDENKKELLLTIPLTNHTGKIRVKERDNIYGYGIPYATKQKPFNLKNYIEWQISYYTNNINLTTLQDCKLHITDSEKYLYELSEYIFYFMKFGIVSKSDLENIYKHISSLEYQQLIEHHSHSQIKRTHPNQITINNLDFEKVTIEYPQLIYRFGEYEIIAEITIKEKQRAIGIQAMLYLSFPITELLTDNKPLLGRSANTKEVAYFKFDKSNYFILLEMLKIFGMLSIPHRDDILTILELLIRECDI
ncbi:MAG TPA: R.Pab1 family restriction endonuclease [Campylobacterales bacterium]|nr:R.Pab1 family restriction endonuclease [Campylobacterales bacterium]